jgi:hypothetical protein
MTLTNEQKKKLDGYGKGKSICACGHLGDGVPSSHAGIEGHGGCMVDGCPCQRFTWSGWTKEFGDYYNLATRHGQSLLLKDEGVLI